MDPLKGCVTCEENYRLKPVTPGYQDAVLTEFKTANSLKALRCARSPTRGGTFVPLHKRFRRKLDSEQRVNRGLKVMVEKVSDGVSQVGCLEEELLWNIVSKFKCKWWTQTSCGSNLRTGSRVTNQSRRKEATERAAGRGRTTRGTLLRSHYWRDVGWFKAFGLILRWCERLQTQQASKQSWLHCGMRANVDQLKTAADLPGPSVEITQFYPLWLMSSQKSFYSDCGTRKYQVCD